MGIEMRLSVVNYALEKIEAICCKKGITKYKLAKQAQIPYTTLTNMFKKDTMSTLPTLQKICEGLDITMSQFFLEDESRVDLTEKQKELLLLWDDLPGDLQSRVIGYLEGLKER